jgi:hypothetical protein
MRKRVLQHSSTIKLLSLLIKRKHILAVVSGNRAEYVASNFPGVAAAVSGFGNQPHALEARWREIVTEYSGLALTIPSDRLTALSGLAK